MKFNRYIILNLRFGGNLIIVQRALASSLLILDEHVLFHLPAIQISTNPWVADVDSLSGFSLIAPLIQLEALAAIKSID